MAKKRKQIDTIPKKSFEPPKFNEKEYIQEQLTIGRGVLFSVVWALIVGLITYPVIYLRGDVQFMVIPGILGLGLLYYILPWLKVNLLQINKKSWLNFVFAFLLTWLAVVTISLNAPFSDFSDPMLDDLTLPRQEINAVGIDYSVAPVSIRAEIKDNYKLATPRVKVIFAPECEVRGFGGEWIDMKIVEGEDSIYTYDLLFEDVEAVGRCTDNTVSYTIRALDSRDNVKEKKGSFEILSNDVPGFSGSFADDGKITIDKDEYLAVYLEDNAAFREVYFTVKSMDGEVVMDGVEHDLTLENTDQLPEGNYRYRYQFSLGKFKKGVYHINLSAIDAGGNEITGQYQFTMEKDGSYDGEDNGAGGFLPGFGMLEAFPILAILVLGLWWRERRGRP